jgi:hypothetical protein
MSESTLLTEALRFRCPDCTEELDLTITVGPAVRKGDAYVMFIGCDMDAFRSAMTSHVMATPELHPTFVHPEDGGA